MNGKVIGSLILFCFGLVLINCPMELFERNYPEVVKRIKGNKKYMLILKGLGIGVIVVGGLLMGEGVFSR